MAMAIFEAIPEGLCKETIRARAKDLRTTYGDNRDPQHLQASLRQAFAESVDSGCFPEVWTYIRAMTPAPWDENDLLISFAAVEKAELLMKDVVDLTQKFDDLNAKYMNLLRATHLECSS